MYMAMSYGIYTFMQIVMPTPKSFALWRIFQWFVSERFFSYHVVELAIAEMACVSRNVCRTFHVPFLLFQILRTVKDFPTFHFWARCLTSLELNSALSVRPRILVVEFVFAEIASTSQTIRTSFLTMLTLVWSSGRFLTAKPHILL